MGIRGLAQTVGGLPSTIVDPFSLLVSQGERNFYILDFPSDSPSVEISVVPDYGDPDMYIRLDDKVPNRDNAQYRSNSVAGEEVVLIKKTDDAYKNSCAGKDRCHVYIAVYGYDNSQYTITAAKSDGITTLRENVPARENVDAGHYEYFKFTQHGAPQCAVQPNSVEWRPRPVCFHHCKPLGPSSR